MSDPTVALQERIDKGEDIFVELGGFKDGKNSPFKFYFPQGKTLTGLVNHFNTITHGKGEEVVLMLANGAVAFRFRGKAAASILDDAERNQAIKDDKTLLITPEDAMTYEPGTRELTSEAGIVRAKAEAIKKAAQFKAAGDVANYKIWATKVIALRKQLDEVVAASVKDILIDETALNA